MISPLLFTPITIREVTFRNRVVVAPMATYSAVDGIAQDFHFAHWGRLVLGGAGCAEFRKAQKVVPAIQLAHAGRKGSMQRPWFGNGPLTAEDVARGEWMAEAPRALDRADPRRRGCGTTELTGVAWNMA